MEGKGGGEEGERERVERVSFLSLSLIFPS